MDLLDDDGLMDIRSKTEAKRTDPQAVTKELRDEKGNIPERNKALGLWAERLGDGGSVRELASTADEECHLCTSRGRSVCKQCSRLACASHFWLMFGLCKSCANEDSVKAFHKEGDHVDGANWLADDEP